MTDETVLGGNSVFLAQLLENPSFVELGQIIGKIEFRQLLDVGGVFRGPASQFLIVLAALLSVLPVLPVLS
jgi:hypothetical protein